MRVRVHLELLGLSQVMEERAQLARVQPVRTPVEIGPRLRQAERLDRLLKPAFLDVNPREVKRAVCPAKRLDLLERCLGLN